MFKNFLYPLSILAVLAMACNKTNSSNASASSKKEVSEEDAYEKFKGQANDGKTFGEKITAKGAIAYDDLLPKLKKLNGTDKIENIKVSGSVEAVCKAKGCWMNIASQQGASPMFVKFKDYAFFMPKDLAGKKVVMQGYAFKEVTDVATLRHFAEDEGKSKEEIAKINTPKEEYKFMASGVIIVQ
jgi:Domain of unknown function (DUF4920)